MINKIGFISYNVSNLQQSINFYQNLLGFKLILSHDRWAEFNISGQRFAIHEINNSRIKNEQPGSIVYFEANPIETIVKNLQDKGVKLIGKVEVFPYGKLILFLDPDKNSLGLYEPLVKNKNSKKI
jgi:predicted enzyme related to lactoylglutathione lyase